MKDDIDILGQFYIVNVLNYYEEASRFSEIISISMFYLFVPTFIFFSNNLLNFVHKQWLLCFVGKDQGLER